MNEENAHTPRFEVVGSPSEPRRVAPAEGRVGLRVMQLALRALGTRTLELIALLIAAGLFGVAAWRPTILRLIIGVAWALLVVAPLVWRAKSHE